MNDQKFAASLNYVILCLLFSVIKVNHFLYRFIILLYLNSSFSLTKSFLISYTYVSIESIDCILLSSLELKGIQLISSVKTLRLSLLNIFYILILIYYFLCILYVLFYRKVNYISLFLFLDGLFYSQVDFLLKNFIISNLSFLFMTCIFLPFSFLASLLSPAKHLYIFAHCPTSFIIIFPANLSFI